MLDPLREYIGEIMVASNISEVLIILLGISFLSLSCGGSGGGGEIPTTPAYPAVVFMADKDNDGTVELYAAFDDGIDIRRLSNSLDPGGNVVDFKVSPDGLLVAYVADQAKDELFVVPVDKSASENARKISGTPMAGAGLKKITAGQYAFAWAPDSSRIAYLADQNTAGEIQLYSNTPDGTSQSTILLSDLPGSDRDVEDFAWSPDFNIHRLIAYRADEQTDEVIELFTTAPDSTFSQKISSGIGFGSNVTEFKWAPDARRIAYIADKNIDKFELYTTIPNILNDVLVSGSVAATSDVINFKWSPNSAQIAYLIQLFSSEIELLTTAPASLASISISSDLKDTNDGNYGWSADSSLIAFIADENTASVYELFTSDPTDVTTKRKVSGNLVGGGEVTAFKWAPSALLLAYVADQDIDDTFELFTTNPPPAVKVIKVSKDLLAGLAVEDDFTWSPDNSLIAYRADQNTLATIELFTTDPDGSINNKVSGTLAGGGNVTRFEWDGTGSAIGYLADQITAGVSELFASLPDGGNNTKLSGPLAAGGDVSGFEWVPE